LVNISNNSLIQVVYLY